MPGLFVHRINFYEPDPKSIRCIAFDKTTSRLAVSRSDASIEIWDVRQNAYVEKVIPGAPDTSVETLAWCNGRLFSAGLHGYLYEYDLSSCTIKHQLIVTSGCPVWCMAVNNQKTILATGNEDGHVVLHDFSSEGLDFQKKFDKQEGCILCLSWHKDGHVIVTGSIDTIRVWNVETGHMVNRMILGRATKNTPTVVWCISVLSDMTIVSGDSCGKTSFWDGNTGTLLSNTAVHKDDVLTLCVSEDEETIYTSGVDPIIQMFMKLQSNGKWLKSVPRIVHTHDVRALQLAGNFLVSGGDDCNLVFTKYPPKTTIKYFPFCQMSYSVVAPLASCILLRYPSHVELWKFGETSENPRYLLQVKTRVNEVIRCSSVSADAKWLAYSSQHQTRLFYIHMEENSSNAPSIAKICLPKGFPKSPSILLFTPDSTKLICYSKGIIYILKCNKDLTELQTTIEGAEEDSDCQVHLMDASPNSLYLACGSQDGNVKIYNLKTAKSQKVVCKLPQYKYQPSAMKFDSSSKSLIVAYTDRKVVEYSLEHQAYTKWSKNQKLLDLKDASFYPITSIVVSSELSRVFLQDENHIYIFNKEEQCRPASKKFRSEESSISLEEDNFKTLTKYEHISSIHGFRNHLVVVQIPSGSIEDALPPPIWKKKYGT